MPQSMYRCLKLSSAIVLQAPSALILASWALM